MPRQRAQPAPISFLQKPLGINTVLGQNQLQQDELVAATNWMIDNTGKYVMRPGLLKVTNTGVGSSVIYSTGLTLEGTEYRLIVDANYELYYLDSSDDPISIGTLEGKPVIFPFSGYAVICDGGYLKTWDGTTLRIAYDDGTGTAGFQFDNSDGAEDSGLALGNGTNIRVAYKFTSLAWTAGWTIPPTTMTVKLKKAGTLAATSVTAKIRRVSDDAVFASKELLASANSLTTSYVEHEITFTSSDITAELEPSIAYYLSIEWQGGDGSNYILVGCSTATTGAAFYYTAAIWTADVTKDPLIALHPGMPPKASFGEVKANRAWLAGDSDNAGVAWYSNTNTPYDYSTDAGGGYVGIIDDDTDSWPVGSMFHIFGNLYFLGTQNQPYLAIFSGSTPGAAGDFVITEIRKGAHSNFSTTIETKNNVLFANKTGVDTVIGVEAYGDLRFEKVSGPVRNLFDDYYSSTAFAAYNPKTKQYIVKLTGHSETLVAHVGLPTKMADEVRFPWTQYYFAGLTPTSFAYFNGDFHVGCSNGHLYKFDDSITDDDSVTPLYTMWSSIQEVPFAEIMIERAIVNLANHGSDGTFQLQFKKAMSGSLIMETGWSLETGWSFETPSYFSIEFDTSVKPLDKRIGYITDRFQWGIGNIIGCGKLYVSNVTFKTRMIGGK